VVPKPAGPAEPNMKGKTARLHSEFNLLQKNSSSQANDLM
jgi:hypothetical protein